ncbi:hypothetical protein [Sphingomonas colocasiae]|uniref:VCBS repeat-containing protein n=1 Tax=Sphingomonas colocasiae TaxID=1848973 RepID=A0ABS7PUD5_9SPHN|nr:hypothetical protein [Sphingomonas colocasiae]MBY8824963.1 hypothetical protein [Sphingomonas colocasiae]
MVRKLDANGDGLVDYLVYSGGYRCPGAFSAFAPGASHGAPAYLFLGRGKGRLQQVWTDNSWKPEVARQGRRNTITVPMRGRICGDHRGREISVAGRYSCEFELRPDAEGRWRLRDRTMK